MMQRPTAAPIVARRKALVSRHVNRACLSNIAMLLNARGIIGRNIKKDVSKQHAAEQGTH
jgi:hypothetical protein